MRRNKDRELLERIIEYCSKIESVKQDKLLSRDLFEENELARDAISFYVFQIGELSGGISEELKATNEDVPWRNIKGIRNIIAHAYVDVDHSILWEVITDDIPVLKQKCESILLDLLEAESL
jgi:uncharacterized protein with HEPN domain